MDFETIAPYLFFALGVLGRVIVPYILERLKAAGPLSFDWRYVVGQIITAVVALVPLLAGDDYLSQIGSMAWLAALLYGWGAADVGRNVQKAVKR